METQEERITFDHGGLVYSMFSPESKSVHVCGLSAGHCEDSSVVIPSKISYKRRQYEVSWIDEKAFADNPNLQSVRISKGLCGISEYAFLNCTNLEHLELADSGCILRVSAFAGCMKLSELTVAGAAERVPDILKAERPSGNIYFIPKWVTYGVEYYYTGDNDYDEIAVDEENEYYASYEGCLYTKDKTELLCMPGNMKQIRLPKELKSFYEGTLSNYHYNRVEGYEVEAGNKNFTSVDGILYDKGVKTLISCPGGRVKDVNIAEGTRTIRKGAFWRCPGVKSVCFPDSIRSIGEEAFNDCGGITEMELPGSLTNLGISSLGFMINLKTITFRESAAGSKTRTLGNYAFESDGIERIQIPEGVETLFGTFLNCEELKEVILPASLKTIGNRTFQGCISLESISLPPNLERIGMGAFSGCLSLKEIFIPKSVVHIGHSAFAGCSSLESITVDEDNAHYTSACGMLMSKDKKEILAYPDARAGKVVIPSSVSGRKLASSLIGKRYMTEIEVEAGNKSYTSLDGILYNKGKTTLCVCPSGYEKELKFPRSLKKIGDRAFFSCGKLKEIVLPPSVTHLGRDVFQYSDSLERVVFEGRIEELGGDPFEYCVSMKEVRFKNKLSPFLRNYRRSEGTNDFRIKVDIDYNFFEDDDEEKMLEIRTVIENK